MTNLTALGWKEDTLGELDHQKVKAPYIRLNSCTQGEAGDCVFFYDIRVKQPNQAALPTIVLHSFEHLLLAGFKRYFMDKFICVAPMGCQTGFYLVLLNEGDANKIRETFAHILDDIMQANDVPYANIKECGQAAHHDLELSQSLAQELLSKKDSWHVIL